jgi:CheY-like chemotaxis protein
VDDEPDIRSRLHEILALDGHRVGVAASGEETLDRVPVGDEYDYVLADLHMPGLSGLQLLRALESRSPDWRGRVILMSGDPNAGHQLALRDGEPVLLLKPFTREDLREAIRRAESRPRPASVQRPQAHASNAN